MRLTGSEDIEGREAGEDDLRMSVSRKMREEREFT